MSLGLIRVFSIAPISELDSLGKTLAADRVDLGLP